MVSGQQRQTIPTNSEYSLRQVEAILGRPVSLDEWNSL